MKAKTILLSLAVLVLLLVYWQYTRAMQYILKLKKVSFKKIALRDLSGTLYLDVYNPSGLSATVLNSEILITLNNVDLTTVKINQGTFIGPGAWTTLPLPFSANPSQILSIKNIFGLEGILDPDRVMIGFSGYVRVKKWVFTLKIPLRLNYSLTELTEE